MLGVDISNECECDSHPLLPTDDLVARVDAITTSVFHTARMKTPECSDGRPNASTGLRKFQPRPIKSLGDGRMTLSGAVDDCDSSRISPVEYAFVACVEATSPSTAYTCVSASEDRSNANALRLLCSDEILGIVERAVQHELTAQRKDRGDRIGSGDSTTEMEDDLRGIPEEDVSDEDQNRKILKPGGQGKKDVISDSNMPINASPTSMDSATQSNQQQDGNDEGKRALKLSEHRANEQNNANGDTAREQLSSYKNKVNAPLPSSRYCTLPPLQKYADITALRNIGSLGSLLEGGFDEEGGLRGLGVSHPLENKLDVNQSSLPSSATESNLSESSKELFNNRKGSSKIPANIDCFEPDIVRTRSSMPASMAYHPDSCEAFRLRTFPNNASFQRKTTCSSISYEGCFGSPRRTNILLVHRIPVNTHPEHISEMFLKYTSIRPKSVRKITFQGILGKCYVEFMTSRHAELAYDMLVGEEQLDSYGNTQKTVELIGGGTLGVRKMYNVWR